MKNEPNILTKANHFETAHNVLLAPTGLDSSALQGVLGSIMSHQVDYADLYFQYSRSESWGLEEGQVKSGNFSIDQGVGVRAVSGEKTAFAYSDDINLPALQAAANATKSIASIGGFCAPARRGAICRLIWAAGRTCTGAFAAGVTKASGKTCSMR